MTERDDVLREAQRLAEVRSASDPYGAAIRATRMPIVIADARLPDHPIVFANDAFVALSGYDRDEIVGRNCRFLQGPDTSKAEVAKVSAAIKAGEHVESELLNYRKDGTPFWNALFVSPVFDDDGAITHFFGSQVDMTARRAAEAELAAAKAGAEALAAERNRELSEALEQKTVLLHEVDHRVKNNLQLISSLILLQSRRIADPEVRGAMSSMLNRVSALATVHRNLFQTDDVQSFDVSAFMRDIASDLVDAAGRDDIRVDHDPAPARVPASQAAAVALVVNELLTSVIGEALADGPGRIRLAARSDGGSLTVEIEDDGVDARTPAGFGQSLIDLLARQLSAKVERVAQAPGALVRITLPVAETGASNSS